MNILHIPNNVLMACKGAFIPISKNLPMAHFHRHSAGYCELATEVCHERYE